MDTFTINGKKFNQNVTYIGDAGMSLESSTCTLFPYQRRRWIGGCDVFIRTAEGDVFTTCRSISLMHDFGCNDIVRRAWCRAAGVTWKDFHDALKKYRSKERDSDRRQRIDSLRNSARNYGYRLARAK